MVKEFKQYLVQLAKNQNELLELIKKIEINSDQAYEDISEKLSHTLSTSISMMHLAESNNIKFAESLADLKGIRSLTVGDGDEFFSPIQEIMFARIFELIALCNDISVTTIKDDFMVFAFHEIGILRLQEEEQDRNKKEEIFIKCFHYLDDKYKLNTEAAMYILSYFDMYLIFTTTKNHQRQNGVHSIVKQLIFTLTKNSASFNETVPNI